MHQRWGGGGGGGGGLGLRGLNPPSPPSVTYILAKILAVNNFRKMNMQKHNCMKQRQIVIPDTTYFITHQNSIASWVSLYWTGLLDSKYLTTKFQSQLTKSIVSPQCPWQL